MIQIDGDYGEGGGQILRTSLAMSSILNKPIKIKKIRINRNNPGLSYQHLKSVEILKKITKANIEGLEIGSTNLTFKPNSINGGDYKVNIGTAGSITLLLQTILPVLIYSKKQFNIEISGGTDVKWSPTFDYFNNVFLSTLNHFGFDYEIDLKRRGYYPKGGGKVGLKVSPSEINSIKIKELKEITKVKGISHCGSLPEHVAERQAKAASEQIDLPVEIETKKEESNCPGSSITLWLVRSDLAVGASSLGEKGKPAEKVGKECAKRFKKQMESGYGVDEKMGDQLVPYLALYGGEIWVNRVSNHLKTNLWVINNFIDDKVILMGEKNKPGKLKKRKGEII